MHVITLAYSFNQNETKDKNWVLSNVIHSLGLLENIRMLLDFYLPLKD